MALVEGRVLGGRVLKTCVNGEVTRLGLSTLMVWTGSIPADVGLLTALDEYWMLDVNQLSGSIPTQIGLLTGLTQLNLDRNQLSGFYPHAGWIADGIEVFVFARYWFVGFYTQ